MPGITTSMLNNGTQPLRRTPSRDYWKSLSLIHQSCVWFTSFPDWGTSCNAYRRNVRVNTSTRRYIEQDKDFSPLWNKSKGSHFKEFENRPVFFSIEKYGRVSYSIIAKNCEIWTSLYRSVNTADIKKMIKHKIRNNLVWHSRH